MILFRTKIATSKSLTLINCICIAITLCLVHSSCGQPLGNDDKIESAESSHTEVWFGQEEKNEGTIKDRQRLIEDLFKKKDYDIRNYPSNVTVYMGASLRTLNLDGLPRKNLVQADMLTRKLWVDSRLQWDAKEYGNISVISVPSNEVWKPDIRLLNSASNPTDKECADSNVLVACDGQVLWVTPCQFNAPCDLTPDVDGQNACHFAFGSWAWAGSTMDLQFYKKQQEVDFTFYSKTPGIYVIGGKAERVEKQFGFYSETFQYKLVFDILFKVRKDDDASSGRRNIVYCQSGSKTGPDGRCVKERHHDHW